jgi:hypothetical protein
MLISCLDMVHSAHMKSYILVVVTFAVHHVYMRTESNFDPAKFLLISIMHMLLRYYYCFIIITNTVLIFLFRNHNILCL